ncbi:hypothetical protein ALC57_13383 [Trachymyrmex cornetzi]|uniref:Uncharacterized protein n=1 Tax=Trachymyrmex cornetzi TaxID=471704 RepID=A0A195DN15_9HYME|nr:hypothetical protein ALC57_13383 [Trachymyrmex cornetzi]
MSELNKQIIYSRRNKKFKMVKKRAALDEYVFYSILNTDIPMELGVAASMGVSGGEGLAAVGAVARRVLCNQSCFGASENPLPRPLTDGITRAVSSLLSVVELSQAERAARKVPSSVDSFDLLLFLVVTMADDEVLFDDVYELCEIIGK